MYVCNLFIHIRFHYYSEAIFSSPSCVEEESHCEMNGWKVLEFEFRLDTRKQAVVSSVYQGELAQKAQRATGRLVSRFLLGSCKSKGIQKRQRARAQSLP